MSKQTLFTIECSYNHGSELVRYVLRNFTAAKLKELREVIITSGLMIPRAVDEWIIVLPHQIFSIVVVRQKFFHREETSINSQGMTVNAG